MGGPARWELQSETSDARCPSFWDLECDIEYNAPERVSNRAMQIDSDRCTEMKSIAVVM